MLAVCSTQVVGVVNSHRHRSSFEVFVNNLKNQEGLSLLLSALAKLWHMVQVSKHTCTLQHLTLVMLPSCYCTKAMVKLRHCCKMTVCMSLLLK